MHLLKLQTVFTFSLLLSIHLKTVFPKLCQKLHGKNVQSNELNVNKGIYSLKLPYDILRLFITRRIIFLVKKTDDPSV